MLKYVLQGIKMKVLSAQHGERTVGQVCTLIRISFRNAKKVTCIKEFTNMVPFNFVCHYTLSLKVVELKTLDMSPQYVMCSNLVS